METPLWSLRDRSVMLRSALMPVELAPSETSAPLFQPPPTLMFTNHRAERRLLPSRRAAELIWAAALRTTLQVLRLHFISLLLQTLDVRILLGDSATELGERSTVFLAPRRV